MKVQANQVAPHMMPSEFLNELVKQGQIPASMVRGIPMAERLGDFCRCGHDRKAHDELGICHARACVKFRAGCTGFVLDQERVVQRTPLTGRMMRIPLEKIPDEKGGYVLRRKTG